MIGRRYVVGCPGNIDELTRVARNHRDITITIWRPRRRTQAIPATIHFHSKLRKDWKNHLPVWRQDLMFCSIALQQWAMAWKQASESYWARLMIRLFPSVKLSSWKSFLSLLALNASKRRKYNWMLNNFDWISKRPLLTDFPYQIPVASSASTGWTSQKKMCRPTAIPLVSHHMLMKSKEKCCEMIWSFRPWCFFSTWQNWTFRVYCWNGFPVGNASLSEPSFGIEIVLSKFAKLKYKRESRIPSCMVFVAGLSWNLKTIFD